jgi:glycine/D-amino acid oxidase-like deaminating enzyme
VQKFTYIRYVNFLTGGNEGGQYASYMPQLPEKESSLWRQAYPDIALYPQLEEDIRADIVIVGGGITGLTAAYLLCESGASVVVIEKDTIGGGTTGRTTGKVTSQHSLIYKQLCEQRGERHARNYAAANQAAVEKVAEIVATENIDCDFARDDNYVFTSDRLQTETFRREAAAAQSLGLPASFEKSAPLPFDITAAVKFSDQAKIHSQRYLLGLAEAIIGAGGHIFEQSNVTGIRDGNPTRVRTAKATAIARDVIVATSVPTLPLAARGSYCLLEYPTESYIVAGRLPGSLSGMYISPDKDNYSILPIRAGSEEYLLIGGESHIPGLGGSRTRRFNKLADYAEERFGMSEILYKWSDRDYMGYDGMPLVGKIYSWSQHVYVASGFMKWGLSNGTAAAMILRDLITGEPNEWAESFAATRLDPVKSIPRVAAKYILRR